jgi:hypothetical protein
LIQINAVSQIVWLQWHSRRRYAVPSQEQPLDDALLGLHAATQDLSQIVTDPPISARLAEIAGELLELACLDARICLSKTASRQRQRTS